MFHSYEGNDVISIQTAVHVKGLTEDSFTLSKHTEIHRKPQSLGHITTIRSTETPCVLTGGPARQTRERERD